MTILSLVLFKYALLVLSIIGLIESHMIMRLNQGDLRIILRERVNGPKKLSTELRINQSAYLLAVFCILFLIGSVQALSPLYESDDYMRPVVRVGLLMMCGLLILKQRTVRKHRERLDLYYDAQRLELDAKQVHIHRRSDDPPAKDAQ